MTTQAKGYTGYASPLNELASKPSVGDRFEAKRTAIFSGPTSHTLTVISIEERYVADGSGQTHNGFYVDTPGDDTRTLYVVTLEAPDGRRFEVENWAGNLGW